MGPGLKKEKFPFLLRATLNDLGFPLMKEIYIHAIGPRNPGESLEDQILRITGMSNEKFENKFNPEIRHLLANDPCMDSFDISAMFTLCLHGCVNLAHADDRAWISPGTLENNLRRIKDDRNDLIHSNLSMSEAEFYDQLEKQRTLLMETALLAKSKFPLGEEAVKVMINQIHSRINDARDTPFETNYFTLFDATSLINSLKSEGIPELKEALRASSIVNPAFLFTERNLPMEVAEIFTPLEIVGEGEQNTNQTVCLNDVLKVANDEKICIILLEGIAGIGKTTIISKIISDWLNEGDDTIKQINDYDFIIPMQCRERGYKTVARNASALMPTARKRFREENHMTTCLLACKTFFILDGLDEITDDSQYVLTELLKIGERGKSMILLTTRPEKIQETYKMILSEHSKVLHLRINGVAEIHRVDFITKYHTKLKDLGVSTQCDANGLLTYLRTTGVRLQDQWTLPLNLTLVTLLWGIDDDRILSITCPIELAIIIRDKCHNRLEERVVTKIGCSLDAFKRKMKVFFSLLSEIALVGIRDSDLLIPYIKIQKLRHICNLSDLPIEELFGTFLVQKHSWAFKYVFTFPHKSKQELYAATHIYNRVFDKQPEKQKTEEKLNKIYSLLTGHGAASAATQEVMELIHKEKARPKTITEVLTEVNREVANPPSMGTYQNTLTSLLGILHHAKATTQQEYADEIIKLLDDAGVKERHHWIAVLNKVKCDPVVAKTLISTVPNIMNDKGDQAVAIGEQDVFAYATLLEHEKPKRVILEIQGNPTDIPRLQEVVGHLVQGKIPIDNLDLAYLFRNPTNRGFRSCLNALLDKCPINEWYTGPLPSEEGGDPLRVMAVKGLRKTRSLIVPLFDPNEVKKFFSFLNWREIRTTPDADGLPIRWLGISVGKDVTASHVPRSITTRDVEDYGGNIYAFFPDVEDTKEDRERVASFLRTLGREYFELYFPRYQGIARGGGGGGAIRRLLLALQGIKVNLRVVFPTCCRPSDDIEREELEMEGKRILEAIDFSWELDDWEEEGRREEKL